MGIYDGKSNKRARPQFRDLHHPKPELPHSRAFQARLREQGFPIFKLQLLCGSSL